MNNVIESRTIYYDPTEKLILVNRKTGKTCTFLENDDSYLVINDNTEENIIFKQISFDEMKCYSYLESFMNASSGIKLPKSLTQNLHNLFNYMYDSVYSKEEAPEFCENYNHYYLHVVTYKNTK